ncbi:MAG: HAMP domain-containing sensor histidine kinase [Pirellulales bacterium]
MKRPWQVWLVFGVCVVAAAAALVMLTRQALQANRLRLTAQADAELEQRVSLALWRMDTELAPLVANEIVRPASAYRPRESTATVATAPNSPPDVAQQQVESPFQQQALQATVQMPVPDHNAPRTVEPPPYVLLQFEARPDGSWHSPQLAEAIYPSLPNGPPSTTRLDELAHSIGLPQLLAKLPSAALPSAADIGSNWIAQNSAKSPAEYNEFAIQNQLQFFEGNREEMEQSALPSKSAGKGAAPSKGKSADLEQRNLRYQAAAQQNLLNQQQAWPYAASQSGNEPSLADEQVGVTRPIWLGDRLVLVRRVGFNGETTVQGCWLDWPLLKTRLLAETADLLPNADLVAVREESPADPARMLAGLPVRLVVPVAAVGAELPSTLQWSLGMAWGAMALAALAAAALLAGVMALSERRAAFVSSVTHELRTPLTTFRMYAEMLARGMVPDAERRQEYLLTLQREAERLTLLVENVLAYARLERGRKPSADDRVTLGELLDRIGPRLASRAAQAHMQCDVQIEPSADGQELTTDQNVVEQILFNLVDNAAKYARDATDRRIHVEVSREGSWVRLAVRDHGPGIEQSRWSGPMRAFGKTAEQSAESAPGVGLGLALCRRLAKQLGGRLEIAAAVDGGATVMLMLPVE